MASGPITSWQIEEEKVETVTDFTFLGSKIIADGDCNHKIKRCLLLGRKAITNLDSIFKKQRHHSANKGLYIKAMVFPVVMYKCESWAIKKAEYWRIYTCKLWRWRRLLRVPWTARRSNQSILREIKPDYSLEGPMLKLKLQYFGYLMLNSQLTGKDPDAGKDWGQEEKGVREDEMFGWHHWHNHEFEKTPGDSERLQPSMLQSIGLQRVGHDLVTKQQHGHTVRSQRNLGQRIG